MSGAPTTMLKRATETALQVRPTAHEAWGDADESPTAAVLAQKASFSVLCILLGVMSSSDAKRTIDRIGRASFLGSAVFHPTGPKPAGDGAAPGR